MAFPHQCNSLALKKPHCFLSDSKRKKQQWGLLRVKNSSPVQGTTVCRVNSGYLFTLAPEPSGGCDTLQKTKTKKCRVLTVINSLGLCLGISATKIRERKSPLFHPSGRFGGLQLEVSFLQSHTVITHPQNITPQQSGLHSLRCGSSPLPFPLFFSCCFLCVWFFWSMVGKQLCQDIGHKFIEAFRILLWIDGRNLCTSPMFHSFGSMCCFFLCVIWREDIYNSHEIYLLLRGTFVAFHSIDIH